MISMPEPDCQLWFFVVPVPEPKNGSLSLQFWFLVVQVSDLNCGFQFLAILVLEPKKGIQILAVLVLYPQNAGCNSIPVAIPSPSCEVKRY